MDPSCNISQGDLPFVKLPLIDLAKLSGPDRLDEAQRLIEAFSDVGFCLLSNLESFGYSGKEMEDSVRWFYREVPAKDRFDQLAIKGYNEKNPNVYRGLFPSEKNKLSNKEAYDVGEDCYDAGADNPLAAKTPKLSFANDLGRQNAADRFYEVIYKHHRILKNAGHTILSAIAESGGETGDYFHRVFGAPDEPALSTFRIIMYPSRDVGSVPEKAVLSDGKIISTPAHADSGALTLLQTFGYPGLEIMLDDKQWYQVPSVKDCLVVNVGEFMSRLSNGRFKATIHRVMDIGKDRFSNPFFFDPKLDADFNFKLPRSLLPSREPEEEKYVPYGSFLLRKLTIYTEFSNLHQYLPQWMIDKYLKPDYDVTDWATNNKVLTDNKAVGNNN